MAALSILIIGSGVAGPTLATFLLLQPLPAAQLPHITLLERSPTVQAHGQNIDIRGTGLSIIRKLGLETAIRASVTGEEGTRFVDSSNGVWAELKADRTGKTETGTADIEILRGRLAQICWGRARDVGEQVQKQGGRAVEFLFGDYLEAIEQVGDRVEVVFAKSGARRSFDLVVGADGLQSRTRAMVWGREGEEERVQRLGMYGAFFSMPKSATDGKWRRWYRAPGRRGVMVRPSDRDDRSTVFMNVVNEDDRRLVEVAKQGRNGVAAQKALMKEYFQDAGWETESIVREMEAADDFYYDMVAQVKMDKWSKGRVVLLGDAGYCASPISGMGTTLALKGAYNLAGAHIRHPNDHTAAFTEYEAKMRPLVTRAQKLIPGALRIFNPETAWGIWFLHAFMLTIHYSGLPYLLFKFFGPPANAVKVEEYGFRQMPEWEGWRNELS